jgi:prephenate dehydrogenase
LSEIVTSVETVAIFGVGLIGGSFALALREAGYAARIVGVSSPATIARAITLGVIDEGLPPAEAASRADLILLAQPIGVIIETIGAIAGSVPMHALVTDAGSTKSAIMAAAAGHMNGRLFVGGHPMAGKEARGVEAASAGLFRGRVWGLTPSRSEDLRQPQAREFVQWLGRIGAIPLVLDAAEHDRTVALTSHLPQLASTALAAMLAERTSGTPAVRGPGLEDMTRLALSSFEIWADILASNRSNVAAALKAYIVALEAVHQSLVTSANSDIRQLFERGSEFARPLRDASNRHPA